ncbi:hypothetical protein MKL09_12445 [Methylobacterium sp. J-048]|uniref:hypothetical protein n=1 Tax=Methylobacterium sp. J-048 TaxID=2836635 RepID=UPI001FB999AC|nr:hypothetical protein [Methylobacterium sp. J-048]MCJ2057365.1 hypothetical protein [Methylobacterium sp. J-048]
MIDLALDPSDTRPHRFEAARPGRRPSLRLVLIGLVGASAIAGFGVAASTLMAGLAAPTPIRRAPISRAADWPELKDGLPAVAGIAPAAPVAAKPAEPEKPALRMASLPEALAPVASPVAASPPVSASAKAVPVAAPPTAKSVAVPEAPTKRIPTPTPVTPIAAARQVVVPLPPTRTAALQPPRASETVKARDVAVSPIAPAAKPVATTPAAASAEKPSRKAVAVTKPPVAKKIADAAKPGAAAATVAQAEPADEETEVLGIKLPSLAPAGRKLKESVDALGDAVKKVF